MDLPVKLETTDDVPFSYSSESVKQEEISVSQCPFVVNVFKCNLCEYFTNNRINYKRHQQFKHKLSVLEPFNFKDNCCPVCDYSTSNRSNLSRHMASKHKDVIVKGTEQMDPLYIKLNIGNPSFSPSQDVPSVYKSESVKLEATEISQVLTVKVFICSLCEYSTNDKSNFKRHQQFKHKLSVLEPFPIKDYFCTVCDHRSTHKSNLNRHIASKHKDVAAKGEAEDKDIVETKLTTSSFSETEGINTNSQSLSTLFIPCQFCDFKTKWKSRMIKHVESKHSEVNFDISKIKSCKFCPFTALCRKQLRQHKKIEHKDQLKVFFCNECSFTSNWEDSMKLHNKFHGVMKDFPGVECDYCDFIYKYNPADQKGLRKCKQTLNEHINDEHSEYKLRCDQCEKTVWTQQQLRVHKTKHEYSIENGSYGCDKCDYKCKKAHRLKFHIDAVHLGVKKHLCDLCPAAFATKSSLNKHILSHTDERNFKCQFCEKAFHSKGNLETHIRTHTGEKPFTCDVCGKSFSDQAYFAKHKRLHVINPDGQPVKDFLCQICSKGFTRRTYLQSHMTSHLYQPDGKPTKYSNEFKMEAVVKAKIHGVNKAAAEMRVNMNTLKNWVKLSVHPHICSLCGKAFSYEAQLKKHILTHPVEDSAVKTNIRYGATFKQEVAQYALEQSIQEAVKRYQLPHSTINFWVKRISNPQPCNLCGKSFSNESTVRRHIEQVHKNTPEGAEEQIRRADEMQSSQPFSEFLADRQLLPSEEQIKEMSREKEKKKVEKEELALLAQEIMSREKEMKEKEILNRQFVVKKEVIDVLDMNMFSQITCLTVNNDNYQESDMSEPVKTEPDQSQVCPQTVA